MEAGKLRHIVTLQSKTIGVDAYGGPIETWTDVATIRASVEPLSGWEKAQAQSVSAETSTKITIRYRVGVIAANRITFAGKFYNIQSIIDPDLRHREMIILASEGLNEG